MRQIFFLLIVLAFSGFHSWASANSSALNDVSKPRITVSIAPLAEIVRTIMGESKPVKLLIPADQSPHHFSFKPSHFKLLENTDLIIWVDNHFESGMESLASTLPETTSKLELSSVLDHEKLEADHHFWYSPGELAKAVESIAKSLSELDTANHELYQKNAKALILGIQDWRQQVSAMLQSSQTGVVTQHQFLHSFSEDFNIDPFPSLYNQHDEAGTIRRIRKIEEYIDTHPVQCLLALEIPVSGLTRNLTRKFSLEVINITPTTTYPGTNSGILNRLDILLTAIENCQPSH